MPRRNLVTLIAGCLLFVAYATPTPATESYKSSSHSERDRYSSAKNTPAPAKAPQTTAKTTAAHDAAAAPTGHGHAVAETQLQPEQALTRLLEGNARYVAGKAQGPNRSVGRRSAVAKGQTPFAVIVACSDSRVPPELLFDQGIGDLFVVRTAGNVVDDVALGSIEYAVEHLGAKLVVVLGHKACGAVKATVAGGTAPGHVGSIVTMIAPAVESARAKQGDLTDNAIRANIKLVSQKVGGSEPILSDMVQDGTVKVVGAYYDLETGVVSTTYKPCMM